MKKGKGVWLKLLGEYQVRGEEIMGDAVRASSERLSRELTRVLVEHR